MPERLQARITTGLDHAIEQQAAHLPPSGVVLMHYLWIMNLISYYRPKAGDPAYASAALELARRLILECLVPGAR